MRRREFLGVAGAGMLGALWRPRGDDVATDSAWTKSIYGTDLDWSTNPIYTSLVTVGNGTAYLLWRRVSGIFYYLLSVRIGSTTSIPAGSWRFEMPAVFSDVSDTSVLFPTFVWSGSGGAQVAASTDATVALSAEAYRSGYILAGTGTALLRPTISLYALSFDTGSGIVDRSNPGAWASGDYFSVSGWAACLDN